MRASVFPAGGAGGAGADLHPNQQALTLWRNGRGHRTASPSVRRRTGPSAAGADERFRAAAARGLGWAGGLGAGTWVWTLWPWTVHVQ